MNANWIRAASCAALLMVGRIAAADDVVTQAALPTNFTSAAVCTGETGIAEATLSARIDEGGATIDVVLPSFDVGADILAPTTADQDRPLQVRVQLYSVDMKQLRKLGVDFSIADVKEHDNDSADATNMAPIDVATEVMKATMIDLSFVGFAEALRQNGLACLVAEPVVILQNGRTATITMAQSVGVCSERSHNVSADKHAQVSSTVMLKATELDRQSVQVNVELGGNSFDQDFVGTPDDDAAAAIVDSDIQWNCRFEVMTRYGQPAVLISSPVRNKEGDHAEPLPNVALVLVVRVTPTQTLRHAAQPDDATITR